MSLLEIQPSNNLPCDFFKRFKISETKYPFFLNYYFCILRNKKYYRDHSLIALPETGTCRLLKISSIENYFHVSTYKAFGTEVPFINIEHDSVSRITLISQSRSYQCKKMPIVTQLCSENWGIPVTKDTPMSCWCGKGTGFPCPSFAALNPFVTTADCPLDTHLHLGIKLAFMRYPVPTRNGSTGTTAVVVLFESCFMLA